MQGGDGDPFDDDRLDLRGYVSVLTRRWKVVVITALVFVCLSLLLAFRQDPLYRAQAQVLVRQQTSESVIEDVVSSERQLNNEVELLQSGAVHAAVRAAYDGSLDLTSVRANVGSSSSDIVRVTATASDANDAANLVNLYVTTFVEWRREQRVQELLAIGSEIEAEIEAVELRLDEVRAPLEEI